MVFIFHFSHDFDCCHCKFSNPCLYLIIHLVILPLLLIIFWPPIFFQFHYCYYFKFLFCTVVFLFYLHGSFSIVSTTCFSSPFFLFLMGYVPTVQQYHAVSTFCFSSDIVLSFFQVFVLRSRTQISLSVGWSFCRSVCNFCEIWAAVCFTAPALGKSKLPCLKTVILDFAISLSWSLCGRLYFIRIHVVSCDWWIHFWTRYSPLERV